MSRAAEFRQLETEMGVAPLSSIAPANDTNLGINAAAATAAPRGDSGTAERVATTGQSLASFADIEGAQINKGDVGFFGSQVAKTIGEATTSVFDFFRDKSSDNDNVTDDPDMQARVAAPAMPQFQTSPGFGSGPG